MAYDSGIEGVLMLFNFNIAFLGILILLFFLGNLQNDLVHGWGLDFALRKCVEVSTVLLLAVVIFRCLSLISVLVCVCVFPQLLTKKIFGQ